MKKLGILLLCLTFFSGCQEDKEEKIIATARLTPADLLAPAALTEYSDNELKEKLQNDADSFLATKATDKNPVNPEADVCLENILESKVIASGDTLTTDVQLDLSSCLKSIFEESASGAIVSVTKATVSLYILSTCKGADLSALNGKKLSELEYEHKCAENLFLNNSKFELTANVSVNSQSLDIASTNISAESTADNEPCMISKSDNEYSIADGCIKVSKTLSSGTDPSSDYSRYVSRGLKWTSSEEDAWFTSGSMDIFVNDWKGSINFKADAAPAFSMKKGAETVTGSLNIPSLRLKITADIRQLWKGAWADANRKIAPFNCL